MEKPKVKLIGEDGNVFAIIGKVSEALLRAKQKKKAREFVEKATTSRSYDKLLQLVMKYVEVE